MKRLLAGILIIALSISALTQIALAEEADTAATSVPAPADPAVGDAPATVSDESAAPEIVRLIVETVSAEADGEATVALRIENGNGVDSLQCNLNYNGNAMAVKRVEAGVTFPAEYCVTNTKEAGRVRLAAACAFGLDNENGNVIVLHCKLNGESGSAVTITDAIVSTVGADYVQSPAYVSIVDGGVSVGGGALPPSAVTPWIPETPPPPETPTPVPTEEPAPAVLDTPAPVMTPEPEAVLEKKPSMLPYAIAGVLAVLLAAGIVILLVSSSNKKKRRKKNGGKKRKPAAKSRG